MLFSQDVSANYSHRAWRTCRDQRSCWRQALRTNGAPGTTLCVHREGSSGHEGNSTSQIGAGPPTGSRKDRVSAFWGHQDLRHRNQSYRAFSDEPRGHGAGPCVRQTPPPSRLWGSHHCLPVEGGVLALTQSISPQVPCVVPAGTNSSSSHCAFGPSPSFSS